jgi:hypothetical protein
MRKAEERSDSKIADVSVIWVIQVRKSFFKVIEKGFRLL